MKITRVLMIVASVICFSVTANAQDYPTGPVKIIIPFTPGSATDSVARTVGDELSKIWGQPVTYENPTGQGGAIGAGVAAQAAPDGYTLLISAAYATSPALYRTLPYDPARDFVDIAPLARQSTALLVSAKSEFNSAAEIVAKAEANPGTIKFASPGFGSAAHLAAEKFNSKAGIKTVHVPFKGGPETIAATAKGEVTYSFLPIAAAKKGVESGKLRALAITGSERASVLPNVPTIAEAGYPEAESILWWGIWTTSGTQENVIEQLENDISRAVNSPEVAAKFQKQALEPMQMNRDEFSRFVRQEIEAMKQIVEDAGIERK